jgi:hypothetical protein
MEVSRMARIATYMAIFVTAVWLSYTPAAHADTLSTSGRNLENVATDPANPDELLVANGDANSIQYVSRSGIVGVFVDNVPAPGAIVPHAGEVYFATGNQPGRNGTIEAVDSAGNGRHVIASNLGAPNGMACC